MDSVELEVDLVQLIRQDTHVTFNTSFILFRFCGFFFPIFSFYSFSWPLRIGSHMVLVFLCTLKSQISQPQRYHATAKQFVEVLTSVNQEKVQDIFRALHLKNIGICAFSSLQNSHRSVLLQVCSSWCAPWWKSAAFKCRCTLFNNLSCLLWHTSSKGKNSLPLCTLPLCLEKKVKTRKLQNIHCTNEVVTTSAPPTDLDQQLHWLTGVRWGCVRESSPRVVWIPSVLGLEK